jgi:hypothetical protein
VTGKNKNTDTDTGKIKNTDTDIGTDIGTDIVKGKRADSMHTHTHAHMHTMHTPIHTNNQCWCRC